MKNEFVTYEQAVALKELGFDEPCLLRFNPDNEIIISHTETYNGEHRKSLFTQAPLKQQVFDFFREKYNIMFQIFYLRNGNYAVIFHKTTLDYMDAVDQINPTSGCLDEIVDCNSYLEAENACIDRLIEIVKQDKNERTI